MPMSRFSRTLGPQVYSPTHESATLCRAGMSFTCWAPPKHAGESPPAPGGGMQESREQPS